MSIPAFIYFSVCVFFTKCFFFFFIAWSSIPDSQITEFSQPEIVESFRCPRRNTCGFPRLGCFLRRWFSWVREGLNIPVNTCSDSTILASGVTLPDVGIPPRCCYGLLIATVSWFQMILKGEMFWVIIKTELPGERLWPDEHMLCRGYLQG